MTEFYVYAYCNPLCPSNLTQEGFEPFYVGKGKGRRCFDHLRRARGQHNSHFLNTIRQIWSSGNDPVIVLLAEGLTEDQAWLLETDYISKWKRTIDGGCLTNITAGGSGGCMPPEVLAVIGAKMRGRTLAPEHVDKIKASLSGRPRADTAKLAIRAGLLGHRHGSDRCAAISAGNRASWEAQREHQWIVVSPTERTHYRTLADAEAAGFGHLYRTYRSGKAISKGKWKGWKMVKAPRHEALPPEA